MGTARICLRTAALVTISGLIAGCVPNSQETINIMKPAATAIPSGVADPRASAAVSTYRAFISTSVHAQQHPRVAKNGKYSEASDFTRYSVDPIQGQYEAFVTMLARTHHAFRGTPPISTVTVRAIDLDAQPYPLITLSDCQSKKDAWRAYNTRTNIMNPLMTPAIPAPYGIIVDVVYVAQRWSVQTIKADPAGTCSG